MQEVKTLRLVRLGTLRKVLNSSSVFILAIAVLIALWFLLRWWGKQPAKHRVNIAEGDFRNYIEALLYRGYDRGFMIVEAPDGKRFIQFTKTSGRKRR